MILKTTLENIEEFLHKYNELFFCADSVEVQEDDNCLINFLAYRIQVPELKISIRCGDLCSKHGGEYYEYHNPTTGEHIVKETPPPEDAEWEVDAEVTVVCDLEEKDPKKYLGWSTDSIQEALFNFFYPRYSSFAELDNVECFVDTAEFIENEEEAKELALSCEEYFDEDDDWE